MSLARSTLYRVGFWIRETGQALDRAGCRLQCNYGFQEILSRHRALMNIVDKVPSVKKDTFVAPSASLIGDVKVGQGSSVWYGCVLRGDIRSISIGSRSNIQDNTLIHVPHILRDRDLLPTVIGDDVTIGHNALLYGCTVKDEALIGIGATVLEGVVVEKNAIVAAGALVIPDTVIPSGEVWGGNPARCLRKLTEKEMAFFKESALHYVNLAESHLKENLKDYDLSEAERLMRKRFTGFDMEGKITKVGAFQEDLTNKGDISQFQATSP